MLLSRSLRKGLELQSQDFTHEDMKQIFSTDEIVWDDGMEELRQIFTTQLDGIETINGNTKVNLRTLDDYEWYIAFSGEDRDTFNIHTCASLDFWKILNKIGYTNAQNAVLPKSSLNTLMNFALPKASNKIEFLIQKEFDLETSPKLHKELNLVY